MFMGSHSKGRHAIIIGASYAGLVAAAALKCTDWTVEIIEKSTVLLRTGGGVVVQRRMLDYLEQHGVAFPGIASVPAIERKIFHRDGSVMRMPESAAAYTSWDVLLRELENVVGPDTIRRGVSMEDLPDWGSSGEVILDTGQVIRGDVVIAADGIGSRSRRLLVPGIQPSYAGYVAWRGLVDEGTLDPETFQLFVDSLSSYQGEETASLRGSSRWRAPVIAGSTGYGIRRSPGPRRGHETTIPRSGGFNAGSPPPGSRRSPFCRKLRSRSPCPSSSPHIGSGTANDDAIPGMRREHGRSTINWRAIP
jgi:hypothetical protein